MATFDGVRPSLAWRGRRALELSRTRASKPFTLEAGLRDFPTQVRIFEDRYTTVVLKGRPSAIWKGQRWYLKPGKSLAAVPGTSRHGEGLALDIACNVRDNPVRRQIFIELDLITPVAGEPWHAEEKAGAAQLLPLYEKPAGVIVESKYVIIPCPTGGYRQLKRSDGGVGAQEGAPFFGALPGNAAVVGKLMGLTPCVKDDVVVGYWIFSDTGHVRSSGRAPHYDGYAEYPEWHSDKRKIVGLVQTAGFIGPRTLVRYSQIGEEVGDADYVVDAYDLGPEYNRKR